MMNTVNEIDSGPSVRVIDKVSGTVDILVGKMTGNEGKVREGREKKTGEREHETDDDHPGISYTKSGAMRQKCLVRPPPSSHDNEEAVTDVVDTSTLPEDDTASIHQHANYAGPNLTAPPPQHYSPNHKTELKLDSPDRLGAFDLHGGFPTGAPSPGGRGAEVFDPFERAGTGAGARPGQSGVGDVGQSMWGKAGK